MSVIVLQVSCHCLRQSVHHQQDSGSHAAHRPFHRGKSHCNLLFLCPCLQWSKYMLSERHVIISLPLTMSDFNYCICWKPVDILPPSLLFCSVKYSNLNLNVCIALLSLSFGITFKQSDFIQLVSAVILPFLPVAPCFTHFSGWEENVESLCPSASPFCRTCLHWRQTRSQKWGRMCAELLSCCWKCAWTVSCHTCTTSSRWVSVGNVKKRLIYKITGSFWVFFCLLNLIDFLCLKKDI